MYSLRHVKGTQTTYKVHLTKFQARFLDWIKSTLFKAVETTNSVDPMLMFVPEIIA